MPERAFYARLRTRETEMKLRDLQGKFRAGQQQASDAHKDAAYEVALMMREELETKMAASRQRVEGLRTPRGTRHLRRALVSEGNWRPFAGSNWVMGFRVGIPSFLDSTPAAPYWRNLEHGSDVFLGRRMAMFGPDDSGRTGLRDLTAYPSWHSSGVARFFIQQRPIPAYGYLEQGGKRGLAMLHAGGMKRLYELNGVPEFTDRPGGLM